MRWQMPRQMAKIREWGMAGNSLPSSACQGGKLTLTLLPDPGPGGKLDTDLEGRYDKAD